MLDFCVALESSWSCGARSAKWNRRHGRQFPFGSAEYEDGEVAVWRSGPSEPILNQRVAHRHYRILCANPHPMGSYFNWKI